MNTVYCYDWHKRRSAPRDVYTEDEARARHDAGLLYTQLLLDDNGIRRRMIRIRQETRYAYLDHLDDRGRSFMTYIFTSRVPGPLFLSEAFVSTYAGDVEKPIATASYRFHRDGELYLNEWHRSWDRARDLRTIVDDLSALWEPMPEFGEYESLARIERGMPVAGTTGEAPTNPAGPGGDESAGS